MDNSKDRPIDCKEDLSVNNSGNRSFEAVFKGYASRRDVLTGSMAFAATAFFTTGCSVTEPEHASKPQKGDTKLIGFSPVPNQVGHDNNQVPVISADYQYDVLIPWGTPLLPGTVQEYKGDPNNRPTVDEAGKQIGAGHDGMWFFPDSSSKTQGMLVINHEHATNNHVLGYYTPQSMADVNLSQSVHGVSVVALAASAKGEWEVVASEYSRRITLNTPVEFAGPVAESALLQNAANNIPRGTLNNCGCGSTPWGTYLTCEENFNGYFAANEGDSFNAKRTEEQRRYGIDSHGFEYGWEKFDKRFDLSNKDYINETNRFGWVVEIDPFDAAQKPVKRTALGRFKHEAVALAVGKGDRAVAYMGDDQRFDYIYKFVSKESYHKMRRAGRSPLDEGALYVARFNDDGSGEWLELTIDNPALAARFDSQAEVLVYARIAADLLGATPMDRPEWTTLGPDGTVYCTLTNNSKRKVPSAPNPVAPNLTGHIIRWKDSENHIGLQFKWDIFVLSQDKQGTEETFGSPDALWADKYGRIFVGTDGGQEYGLPNQLLVFDAKTGESRRLLTGVNGCEVTGITVTPDQRAMFVNLQHPGNGSPQACNFPAPQDGVTIPRDCTLVITRKDGGVVGS